MLSLWDLFSFMHMDNDGNLSSKDVKTSGKLIQFLDGVLDEKCKQIVRVRAIIGAIALAFPLWGLDTIIYVIALWTTYSGICSAAGIPFGSSFFKHALMGFIVNIIVVGILNFVLDFIPVAGWIGAAIVGAVSIYLSGIGYIATLKGVYGKKANTSLNFANKQITSK